MAGDDFSFAFAFAVVGTGAILALLLTVHRETLFSRVQALGFLGGLLALVLLALVMTWAHPQRFVRDEAFFNHAPEAKGSWP